MHKNSRKERIIYILAAVLFVLLAAALMVLLLSGSDSDRGEDERPRPAATAVPTATPEVNTITIAGKAVDPAADSFDLSGRTLTAEDRAAIASMKNLTTLSLTNCGLGDLSFLSGLTGLTTLYLPENNISDLTPLAGLSALRTLYLDKNPLADLTPLTNIPGLTTLSLKGVPIADYVLEDLQASMPNCKIFNDSTVAESRPISLGGVAFTEDVEQLDLSNRGISDIAKLSYCLKLRDLNLAGNPLESYNTLLGLPKLEVLSLARTGLGDENTDMLKSLQKLIWLDLTGNEGLSAEKLDELKKALPNCEIIHDEVFYTVELGGQRLTSDMTVVALPNSGVGDISELAKFKKLQSLALGGNAVADISALRELLTLEELDLSGNMVTDISALAGHTSLRRLNLANNSIGDIYALASCAGLQELDLSYNNLDYLTHLTNCLNLVWLDLTGNPGITAEQINRLQFILPNCTIVTDIDLTTPSPEPAATPAPTEETAG